MNYQDTTPEPLKEYMRKYRSSTLTIRELPRGEGWRWTISAAHMDKSLRQYALDGVQGNPDRVSTLSKTEADEEIARSVGETIATAFDMALAIREAAKMESQ